MHTFEIKARADGSEELIPVMTQLRKEIPNNSNPQTDVKDHFGHLSIDKTSPRGRK